MFKDYHAFELLNEKIQLENDPEEMITVHFSKIPTGPGRDQDNAN